MVNAFSWKAFTTEERAARKETRDLNNTSHKRSAASSKRVERNRVTAPTQANIGGMSKYEVDPVLTLKKFNVYTKYFKNDASTELDAPTD
jgi:hypothetical protein